MSQQEASKRFRTVGDGGGLALEGLAAAENR